MMSTGNVVAVEEHDKCAWAAHSTTAGRALAPARGVRSEESPSRVAWDSCLQDDRKGKESLIITTARTLDIA
jgi:hypothetical protein